MPVYRGGNRNSNYIANINYKSGQGIIKRSDNRVLTTRLEINHSMWDNLLKFNLNIMGKEQKYTALGVWQKLQWGNLPKCVNQYSN